MAERPIYTVMVESLKQPGKMTPTSPQYVQRASAFKRARRLAAHAALTGRRVTVWEYAGPGASKIHQLPRAWG